MDRISQLIVSFFYLPDCHRLNVIKMNSFIIHFFFVLFFFGPSLSHVFVLSPIYFGDVDDNDSGGGGDGGSV